MSVMVTSLGIYGMANVRIEFDFLKFLPEDSTLSQWYNANKQYFPEEGHRGHIYFSGTDLVR